MLRYRFLLVDTEKSYERPQQLFANRVHEADGWIASVLKSAGKSAYVQIYQIEEKELRRIYRPESPCDESAISSIQPAKTQADQ